MATNLWDDRGAGFLVLLHSRSRELLEVIEPTLALGDCARARQLCLYGWSLAMLTSNCSSIQLLDGVHGR